MVGRQRTCCACCRTAWLANGSCQKVCCSATLLSGKCFLDGFLHLPKKEGHKLFFFTPIFFIASCTAVFPAALFLQKSQALALLAAHWACKSSVGFIERTGPTAVLFRGHLTVKMYVIHNCVAKKEIPCASIHVFSPLSHKSRTAINAVCLYTWVWAWIAHYLISKAVLFCIWEHV